MVSFGPVSPTVWCSSTLIILLSMKSMRNLRNTSEIYLKNLKILKDEDKKHDEAMGSYC